MLRILASYLVIEVIGLLSYRGYRAASKMASDGRSDVSGEGDVLEGLESLSETNKQKVLEYISQMQQKEGSSGRMEQNLHTAHLQSSYAPKVGCYSGSKDLGKGEINYPQWRHEVMCLVSEGYPVSTVLQSIRRSLRGTAAEVLLNMGIGVQPQEIIGKLDIVFGVVLTNEAILEEFYASRQRDRETAVQWGCRVERLLKQAKDQKAIRGETEYIENMARTKLWSGLRDGKIKEALRHRFDSGEEFVELLRQTCMVEHEFQSKLSARVNAQTIDQGNEKLNQILEKLSVLELRVSKVEHGATSQGQGKQCKYCKRMGHVIEDCMTLKRNQSRREVNAAHGALGNSGRPTRGAEC